MIRTKGEFEANVARQRQVYMAGLAKQAAEIANTNAANRRRPTTGPGGYDPDAKSGKSGKDRITALSLQHGDELKLIEKRYNDEVSTIKAAGQNAQNLLKASHDAKLINSGEFYARELGLAADAEAKLLAQAQSSATAAMKAVDAGRETVSARFQKWFEENQGKEGFAERYLTEWEKVSTEMTKLGTEYDNLSSKLSNDQERSRTTHSHAWSCRPSKLQVKWPHWPRD